MCPQQGTQTHPFQILFNITVIDCEVGDEIKELTIGHGAHILFLEKVYRAEEARDQQKKSNQYMQAIQNGDLIHVQVGQCSVTMHVAIQVPVLTGDIDTVHAQEFQRIRMIVLNWLWHINDEKTVIMISARAQQRKYLQHNVIKSGIEDESNTEYTSTGQLAK